MSAWRRLPRGEEVKAHGGKRVFVRRCIDKDCLGPDPRITEQIEAARAKGIQPKLPPGGLRTRRLVQYTDHDPTDPRHPDRLAGRGHWLD